MLDVPNTPKTIKTRIKPFHTQSETAKAAEWLDGAVAASQDRVTAQMIELTPALAEVLMQRNDGNRPVREQRVINIARDIKAGLYKINGESIIIAKDGHLNDGQHRCQAVLVAGQSIQTLLTIGVDRETQDTVDHGTSRTPGDDLALHGYNNTMKLAAAARYVWQWRKYGHISNRQRDLPTRMELVETVEANPGILNSVHAIESNGVGKATAICSVSVMAFCHFAFKTVSNDHDVTFFFESLIGGANLERGNPILNIRNRFIAARGTIMNSAQKSDLLFQAWNAHRKGESRVAFRFGDGELPLIES